MKFNSSVISFFLAILSPIVQAQQACVGDLITNGSFEDGPNPDPHGFKTYSAGDDVLPGWEITHGYIDYVQAYWPAADGVRSIDMNGSDLGKIKQTITTVPGQKYRVRFALSGNPDFVSDEKELTVVTVNGQTNFFEYDVNAEGNTRQDMKWKEVSFDFTADSTSTEINFTGDTDAADFAYGPALDNVRVCPVLDGPIPDGKNGGIGMDPHIKKWTGSYYDFQGECDLVLVTAPEFNHGMGLDVHVRTTIRYQYSFVEQAALKLGEDVLEASSWGQVALNGVYFSDPSELQSYAVGGFPVTYSKASDKQHSFVIQFDEKESVTMSTFKDFVNVKFNVDLSGSRGLMGDYTTGASLARDGFTVIEDTDAFGQEWQVLASEAKLFQTIRAPQAPAEQCRFPSADKKQSRRLGESAVARSAAEAACGKAYYGEQFDNCVSDVLLTGDFELADAPGAY